MERYKRLFRENKQLMKEGVKLQDTTKAFLETLIDSYAEGTASMGMYPQRAFKNKTYKDFDRRSLRLASTICKEVIDGCIEEGLGLDTFKHGRQLGHRIANFIQGLESSKMDVEQRTFGLQEIVRNATDKYGDTYDLEIQADGKIQLVFQ